MRGVPLTGGKFETSFSSLPLFISSALIPGQSNQIPAGAHNRLLIGLTVWKLTVQQASLCWEEKATLHETHMLSSRKAQSSMVPYS